MSDKARSFFKDVLLVAAVFAALSGAYCGFAVAERYRALTQAYIAQSQELIKVIQSNQKGNTNVEEQAKPN